MSREVIGDAPAWVIAERTAERAVEDDRLRAQARLASVLRASRQALMPVADVMPPAGDGHTTTPRRPATVRSQDPGSRLPLLAAAAAVLFVASALVAFPAAAPGTDVARGVVAVVTGASAASTNEPTRRALLSITISNPGDGTVTVDGYAATTRSTAAVGLDSPSAHAGAGESVELTVDVALQCDRPAPLLLPNLVIRAGDGGRREVPAVGAVSALTDVCASGLPEARPLVVTGVRREGSALVVGVAAPSNRRTELREVRATGVTLEAGALPVRVDRHGVLLRILPPASCPRSWREDGIPSVLDVAIDATGPAIVRLDVGAPLVAWALDVVCRTP